MILDLDLERVLIPMAVSLSSLAIHTCIGNNVCVAAYIRVKRDVYVCVFLCMCV